MAYVTAPDGSSGTVPDDQLEEAVRQGYSVRQPSQKELERDQAADSPVQAGVEAAVRTAIPLGIGERLTTSFEKGYYGKSEEDVKRGQELRRVENPVATAVGTGVGFLAPAKALSGITGPLRAQGLLGLAKAGALEGGALGLNEVVNESLIQNKPLTAERVASATLESALLGGTFDLGLGVVSKGASVALKRLGGGALSKTLSELGTSASLGEIETKAWARKYGAFEDDIARVAREEGVLNRSTALTDSSVEAANAALERQGQKMGDYLERAGTLQAPKHGEIVSKVLDSVKDYAKRGPMATTGLAEVEDQMRFALENRSSWKDLWDMQSSWRVKAEDATTLRGEILGKARLALRDAVAEMAPKPVGDLGATLAQMNKRYAALNAFASGLEEATLKAKVNGIGLKDLMIGGMIGGPKGIAVAALSSAARKRAGFVLGETLHELGKSKLFGKVSESLYEALSKRMATFPELFGPFRNTIEAALVQGPEATMQTHTNLAMSTVGPEYLSTIGMQPEKPETTQAIGSKLSIYDSMNELGDQADESTVSAIDSLFGSAPGRKAPLPSPMDAKSFGKIVEGLKSVVGNPEKAFTSIPEEYMSHASDTSGMAASKLLQASQYLLSVAPRSPYEDMPASVAQQWEPSPAELDKFNRVKEAIENPNKVLKNMANGYLAPEQVEAIQAVYPAIYQGLQQKIGERLATWKKPLTYQQRLAFSSILGVQALGMSQQQAQILQASFQGPMQSDKPSGSMGRPDGRQDVNEEQIQTESQKLEART